MQWNRVMAVLLVLGAAAFWWWSGHPGYQTEEQKQARMREIERKTTGPTLYRWKDAHGVTQITDQPPKGRKYTIVHIPLDRNVVPLKGKAPEPPN